MALRNHATRASSKTDVLVVPELEALVGTYAPRNKPWTEKDLAILRKYYGKVDTKQLCKYLGRSVSCVQDKARRHGITAMEQ